MKAIRSDQEIQRIREACRIAAAVLDQLAEAVDPGVTTYDLDQIGRKAIEGFGARSACFNYRSGNKVFPAHTCISINEEVVHGIGRLGKIIRPGDVVSLDVVVNYQDYIGDNARTLVVPPAEPEDEALVSVTRDALMHAIRYARAGNRVGDLSYAVERFVRKHQYGIVREFVGHGVGATMHEPPQIPNFGRRGTGPRLKPGMALAIEPMLNRGGAAIEMLEDGWTAVTRDRSTSAHFEHTVLVTGGEPEILTNSRN